MLCRTLIHDSGDDKLSILSDGPLLVLERMLAVQRRTAAGPAGSPRPAGSHTNLSLGQD